MHGANEDGIPTVEPYGRGRRRYDSFWGSVTLACH